MPNRGVPRFSSSKTWNVAKLTSEISSSPRVTGLNDPINCDGRAATDPPADAAKDTPAIPSTDAALLGRFPFEARFVCGIAEFLPYFSSDKYATNPFIAVFIRFG